MEQGTNIIAKNKRAVFDYNLIQKFSAGMVLTGTEVKSIRGGKVSIGEGYCFFRKGELWIRNLHIPEYSKGNIHNHAPRRERKLLLNKRELEKLLSKIKERGYTIVPIELYYNDRGFIKLDIALVTGKTKGDKREYIREKDVKREMDREMKRRL